MSESSEMAEMLCGSPTKQREAAIAQMYMNVATLVLLKCFVSQAEDPEAVAKRILEVLHVSTKNKINDELAQIRAVKDSSMGKIFGSLLPDPSETAGEMQDLLNAVHSKVASFLHSDLDMFGE